MYAISRRFFSAEAVKEVEKVAAEATKQLQKEYASHCSEVMKVRGHHKIAMNTVKAKNGHEMSFDFSYGWPFRYYCKCNTSTEPVTRQMVESFEKDLQEVGIKPDYGVYFTKGLYQGDAAELRCLVVDSKALTKMEGEKNGRAIRSKKCIFFVCFAMTYLAWTFFSEKNPQRRRLIERWHRYVLKDGIDPYAPKEEQVAAASTTMEEKVEEPMEPMESMKLMESIVDHSIPMQESVIETPAVEELKMEEESVEENTNANQEGFFSYVNKTFWWLLELMAEFSSQEIVIIDSDDDFEDNPIIPDNPIIVSHSELENRDSSQLLPYSCFVCGEDETKRNEHVSLCLQRISNKDNKKRNIFDYYTKKDKEEKRSNTLTTNESIKESMDSQSNQSYYIEPLTETPNIQAFKKKKRKQMKSTEIVEKDSIRNTRFAKDCFKGSWTSTYFLSHAHSDHTSGLSKSFHKGTIYATQTTCNLIAYQYQLSYSFFHILKINHSYFFTNCKEKHLSEVKQWIQTTFSIPLLSDEILILTEDASNHPEEERVVKVDVFDANHCPGACLFLFTIFQVTNLSKPFFTTLYTGDFRYSPFLLQNTFLQPFVRPHSNRLDLIYIDNTYGNKAISFPTQEIVIHTLISTLKKYWGSRLSKTPFKVCICIGCYNIGKEKVWLEVAKAFHYKVYLTEDRMKRLECYEDYQENYYPYLTRNEYETPIRLVPMFQNAFQIEKSHLNEKYDKIVLIQPTGWEQEKCTSKPAQDDSTCEYSIRRYKNIVTLGFPYSEHCSFQELKCFLDQLNYKELTCIVDNDGNSQLIKQLQNPTEIDIRNSFKKLLFDCFNKLKIK